MNGCKGMQTLIRKECDLIAKMLMDKNQSYGNSVAEPANIFARSDAMEQINVRIDDKLNRIRKGHEYGNDDTELDLIGYLILKRCVRQYLQQPKEDHVCGKERYHDECQNQPEDEGCWSGDGFGELPIDEVDRAADLFLAHTRGSSCCSQPGERFRSCGGRRNSVDEQTSCCKDPEEL